MSVIHFVMKASSKRAKRILVQSPTMAEWVIRGFRVPPARVEVVEPSTELDAVLPDTGSVGAMRAATGSRILYVGNDSPHKNLKLLVDAVGLGIENGLNWSLFMTLPSNHALCKARHVVGLGVLTRNSLRSAYDHADVLVMPSLVETVGLPMLEAASLGIPVVAADRPYAHDTCGDSALYFRPDSADDLQAKLRDAISNLELRRLLIAKGHKMVERRKQNRAYQRMIEVTLEISRHSNEYQKGREFFPASCKVRQ